MGGPGSAPLPQRKDRPDEDVEPVRDGRRWYVKVRGFALTGKRHRLRLFKSERAAREAGERMLDKKVIYR